MFIKHFGEINIYFHKIKEAIVMDNDEDYIVLIIFMGYTHDDYDIYPFDKSFHLEKIRTQEHAIKFLESEYLYDDYRPHYRGLLRTSDQFLINKYAKAVDSWLFDLIVNEESELRENERQTLNYSGVETDVFSGDFSIYDELQKLITNDTLISISSKLSSERGFEESVNDFVTIHWFDKLVYNRNFYFFDSKLVYSTNSELRRTEPNLFGITTLLNKLPENASVDEINEFFKIDLLHINENYELSDRVRIDALGDSFEIEKYYRLYSKNLKVRFYIDEKIINVIREHSQQNLDIVTETVIDSNGYFEYHATGIFDNDSGSFLVKSKKFWKK